MTKVPRIHLSPAAQRSFDSFSVLLSAIPEEDLPHKPDPETESVRRLSA
jgi:hypothetical protein